MIQLPVHFKDVKSAEQFVSILEEFPYACDLTSGTQSVDGIPDWRTCPQPPHRSEPDDL